MSKEQKSPQSNNDDKKTSFLDEPEIEVMPGVYMTQYGKNKQTTAQANPVTDVQNDLAELESDKESLEQELLALQAQLAALQGHGPQKPTMAQRTGLTGIHLLEQIDIRIDQITKHHLHLLESQTQLEALLELQDDDITLAYEENKEVLIDQLARIEELKVERRAVLESLGPHYAEPEHAPVSASPPVSSNTTTETAPNQNQDDEKNEEPGFWL